MNKYAVNFMEGARERRNLLNGFRIGLMLILVASVIINIVYIERDHARLDRLTQVQSAYNDAATRKLLDHEKRLAMQEGNAVYFKDATGTQVTAKVSMYTSSKSETDSTPCIAASGKNVCKLKAAGTNVCANNDLPFGAVIKIAGLGTCVVWDRMNARYTGTNMVDWFSSSLKEAREHGVKEYQALIVP